MRKEKMHVMVLPFPAQGHITPMIQFSKRLQSKGVKVTLVSSFIKPGWVRPPPAMAVVDISADEPEPDRDPANLIDFMAQFRELVRAKLLQVVEENEQRGEPPVRCLVYDSIIPWALEEARQSGLMAAPLFTQPCCVNAILYAAHLKVPLDRFLPPLDASDLPSFLRDSLSFPQMLGFLTAQFSNLRHAHRVLCNSFDALEPQLARSLAAHWPLLLVGPTVPSAYLDGRLEEDAEYGVGLFEAEEGACMEWLEAAAGEEEGSVVYAAFGSVASVGEEQMAEVAMGLRNCGKKFLWVVRDEEARKLPPGFVEETKERGLVVSWCPQLRVLNHRAVGCFVSHCGWNSTLEALCLGVPMVGIPQWSDQPTNAKFVADVWRVGLRANPNPNGTVLRQEVEHCIREVMDGERSREIKTNSLNWRQLAKAAVGDGGTSDTSIQLFVDSLVSP